MVACSIRLYEVDKSLITCVSKFLFHCSSLISSENASPGLDSNPQDEFLSVLFGARTSPPLHQFLVNSLGEAVP